MRKSAQCAYQIIRCRLEHFLAGTSFVFNVLKYGLKHRQCALVAVKNIAKL